MPTYKISITLARELTALAEDNRRSPTKELETILETFFKDNPSKLPTHITQPTAPKLTSYNTNATPATQTSAVSAPSDAGLKYAPGDLRNTMSNEEIKEYMRSIFAKKAPADD